MQRSRGGEYTCRDIEEGDIHAEILRRGYTCRDQEEGGYTCRD